MRMMNMMITKCITGLWKQETYCNRSSKGKKRGSKLIEDLALSSIHAVCTHAVKLPQNSVSCLSLSNWPAVSTAENKQIDDAVDCVKDRRAGWLKTDVRGEKEEEAWLKAWAILEKKHHSTMTYDVCTFSYASSWFIYCQIKFRVLILTSKRENFKVSD